MTSLSIDPKTSALVLIHLQNGVVSRQTAPHTAQEVVKNAVLLTNRFRELDSTVVLVHVAFRDNRDRLTPPADAPVPVNSALPANWAEIVPELHATDSDIIITKRQWGAFYGTELDLQLRRRGVRTIVLAGIATNFGCEFMARDAYERGYEQIFAEDAMSSMSADWHDFVIKNIFPRIGHVGSTAEVLSSIDRSTGIPRQNSDAHP